MLPESYTSHLTQSRGRTERQQREQESLAQMHATDVPQYDIPDTFFFKSCKESTLQLTVISSHLMYLNQIFVANVL